MRRSALKNLLLTFLAIGFIFPFAADAQTRRQRNQSEQAVREGERLSAQKNYRGAIQSFESAVTIWPGNANAHFQKGKAHYFLGEYDPAVSEYSLALSNGFRPIEVFKVRWAAYEKLRRFDEALADVNNVLKAEPANVQFALASAEINFGRGNYQDSAAAYQKALLQSPNNADLYYWLAASKEKLGDVEGQAAAAEEAIKRNTQFLAESLVILGSARNVQKRIPEAISAFSRALASRPDKVESYRQLAELYRSQNRIDEAIDISKAGLRQHPNNGEIYTDLTWFYSLAGRTEDAIAAGRSATQLLPQKAMGYTNLCRAYNEARRPELAIGACNSALRLANEDGETLFYLGRAYDEMKNRTEAEKYYRRAVAGLLIFTKDNPDYSDGYYLLGNAYAEVGQNAKAVEAYVKCLELNPRFAKANFNIGIIRIIEKNKAGAMEQYNALLLSDKALAEKLKAEIDKL